MSYDENDAARDEFYEQLSRELYTDHKQQAIVEFSADRLKSFYIKHPSVMRPAVDALQEGKWLQSNSRPSAALVFFVSAIELLLKATLLRPVVYGLVHHDGLAKVVVDYTLDQTGFDRYGDLLEELFSKLAKINIREICRDGSTVKLLVECGELQKKRNRVIHKGEQFQASDTEHARLVALAVNEKIVVPMLFSIGLTVSNGAIVPV